MRFPTHWLKIEKLDNEYMLCNVQVKKNASLQTGTGKAEKPNTIHLQTTPFAKSSKYYEQTLTHSF